MTDTADALSPLDEAGIAALVEDPGSAQRVSRALKASGQVADVLRADAPVAGARVVG